MGRMRFGSLLMVVYLLQGCSSLNYPGALLKSLGDGFKSLSYTSDLRATHVIEAEKKYRVCMEPAPDSAYSQAETGDLNLSLFSFGQKEAAEESEGSEDLPLAGRTSYLLLARELNYRACEAAINFDLDFNQYWTLYQANLKILETVAPIEAQNSKYVTHLTISTGATTKLTTTETDTKSFAEADTKKLAVTEQEKLSENLKLQQPQPITGKGVVPLYQPQTSTGKDAVQLYQLKPFTGEGSEQVYQLKPYTGKGVPADQ